MSTPEEKILAQRAIERENRLKEEKKKVEEEIQQGYAAHREQYSKEVDAAREVSRQLAEKKREELTQMRLQQARELAELEAKLQAATQEKLALRNAEGKVEVERRRAELDQMQKDLEVQAELRRSQLNDSSEIIKRGEKLRQEMLNQCREDRKKELEVMNAKTLEMHQKLHEKKLETEERLQKLDEKRNDEQKAQLYKKESIISNGIINSSSLSSSLALEDAFELFKQQCKGLRDQHGKFCMEYDTIEPELLRVHERMKKGRELKDDCDMDGLLAALRVFNERALAFSAAGSTDEVNFQSRIAEVIAIMTQLRSNFNTIKSKIELYDDEEEVMEKNESGISEELFNIVTKMKEMGELMQLFNVIGRDHLQEKLADQMKQAQSSRHFAIANAPPTYDSTKQIKAAITQD
ncbi:hypothetical protein CAEBREN_00106 [Caenorhabditis brenneri]|uniref:Uncharacterized protein n=1 Tax=Caenorhabditis brenneri TaxID=135651 RepID=G0MA44_CAEBE|nr:hypothetical protein CAEBREN_00106 [Caenorhabditis brenneri]